MKNFTKTFLSLSLIGIAAMIAPSISAAEQQMNGRLVNKSLSNKLPNSYPERFLGTGIVTAANPEKRTITIGTTTYVHGINTKVHTLSSNSSSVQGLKINTPIGFNYFVDNNIFYLSEVWILPADSVRAN